MMDSDVFSQIDPHASIEHVIGDVTFVLRPLTTEQKIHARAAALSAIKRNDLDREDREVLLELMLFEYVRYSVVGWSGGAIEYKKEDGKQNINKLSQASVYELGFKAFELASLASDAKKKP